ncbi:helix-turn-helix transcriptional regulator [Streptomyces sp. NPDC002790]|uniref:helix-turn-helix domain-containing protein n=1 Tax=Streptomyces sp. NPDC002790 TaxID=3154431 RepID=UPI00332AE472
MKKQVTSWHAIGAQIAHFRKYVGMTQTGLADQLRVSHDKMASIEQGRRPVGLALAGQIDELLATKGALAVAVAKVPVREKFPLLVADLVELEQKARAIQTYETQVVPGLLQTPEYMRAVFDSCYPPIEDETLEDWLSGRLERQAIWGREHPPWCNFIIEETAFQRPLGGPDVMRAQIRRVLELGGLQCMGIQVMPTKRLPHAGLSGPMVLVETVDHDSVAYLEDQCISALVEDPDEVHTLQLKYGMLRSQALSPAESAQLLDTLLGAS